jgi:hypothetical protein
MAKTTFSGPVAAGTVKNTSGTTPGTVRNIGAVLLGQTVSLPSAAGTVVVATLPAGSQILDIQIGTSVAYSSAMTMTIVDNNSTPYLASQPFGATRAIISTSATGALNPTTTENVGTADVILTATIASAGGGTGGSGVVTVTYIQKNSDGTLFYSNP